MSENSSSNRLPLIIGLIAGGAFLCVCLVAVGAVGAGAYMFLAPGRETTAAATAPSVEYVLDVSQRMSLAAEGAAASRLELAQGVMAEMVRPTPTDTWSGLRVFGSGAQAASCQDTDLLLPLAAGNQTHIAETLIGLRAGASTEAALAEAMIAAIRNLAQGQGARSLVVVTGGQDECQAEAAQLVAEEAARAGIELRTFVIGLQVSASEQAAIKAIAEASGEGVYLDADNEISLRQAFSAVQAYIQSPAPETFTAVESAAVALEQGQPVVPPPPPPQPTPSESEPADDAPPTSSPTPPTAVATSDDEVGETACDHPYFPLRRGATWVYQGSSGGESFTMTWTVTSVTGDRDNAEAIMQADFDGMFTATYTWQCSDDGIVSFDYGNFNFEGMDFEVEGMTFTTEVVNQSGVMLPPPDQFAPGGSWNNAFTIRTAVSMSGMSYTTDFATSQSYNAAGVESVTVRAGTFEALRVESVSTSNISNSLAPEAAIATSSSGTNWYGRGVGWLKIDSVDDGERSSWELISYNIP
jgi:hypothetical protein